MDYQKIYNNIINNAKVRKLQGYKERHHIIPKSMGGSNKKDNIVELTAREHFLCHLLLAKIFKTSGMYLAVLKMTHINVKQSRVNTTFTSRMYSWARECLYGHSGQHSKGTRLGIKHTDAAKEKMRKKRLEYLKSNPDELKRFKKMSKNKSTDHIKKISESLKGRIVSDSSRKKMSESHKGNQLNEKNGKSKPIYIDDVRYPSAREASRQLGIGTATLCLRLKSMNYPNYYYENI